MKRVGAALFLSIVVAWAAANLAALGVWILGGSLGPTLGKLLLVVDVIVVVGVLAAGAAFITVFIYAMSKDST